MSLPICIAGAAGRMGRRLIELVVEAPDLELVGALDAPQSPHLGRDAGTLVGGRTLGVRLDADPAQALRGAAVLVEFSLAAALPDLAAAAAAQGVALVAGSTGLGPAEEAALDAAATQIPLLHAPNFSLGIALLRALARQAAAAFGDAADVEIVELHHGRKADAPSGTALALAESVQAGRADALQLVHGRVGAPGPRAPGELGLHALRGGDAVGEHSVLFLAQGERLELCHRASSRDIFARGALRAARWLVTQAPGRYQLADLLPL